MSKQSFLCSACRDGMCNDCLEIAEELEELLKIRTNALQAESARVSKLERELADEKRRSAMYEQVAKAGICEIIGAWMDKEIKKLCGF